MIDRPHVEGAPGLVWRKRKTGWVAEWHCRTDLARAGFQPKHWRIALVEGELSPLLADMIADRCRSLQDEMLIWARGGLPSPLLPYDGTLRGLIAAYQTDPDSGFRDIRYRTRQGYARLCRRIEDDHGDSAVADIGGREIKAWHRAWAETGHIAMAHSLMGMLRALVSFGRSILKDTACKELGEVLSEMRFKMAPARKERLTAAQAVAIRAAAHAAGRPSIALAQALQFELMLRQKDVIGEWVPNSEPGVSAVTYGNEKWLRGIQWQEIDRNLILRHVTSKRGKEIEVDLRLAPMVLEELPATLPGSGPVIVSEHNGRPYATSEFRRQWRIFADAAGVPRNVFNMDSRAGAISEATDAGAPLEHVRHAATHSNISMTQRYSRDDGAKVVNVMQARVAHRNKGGK